MATKAAAKKAAPADDEHSRQTETTATNKTIGTSNDIIESFSTCTDSTEFDAKLALETVASLKTASKNMVSKGNRAMATVCNRNAGVLQHMVNAVKEHARLLDNACSKDLNLIRSLYRDLEPSLAQHKMPLWLSTVHLAEQCVTQFRADRSAEEVFEKCQSETIGTMLREAVGMSSDSRVSDVQMFVVGCLIRNAFPHAGTYEACLESLTKIVQGSKDTHCLEAEGRGIVFMIECLLVANDGFRQDGVTPVQVSRGSNLQCKQKGS